MTYAELQRRYENLAKGLRAGGSKPPNGPALSADMRLVYASVAHDLDFMRRQIEAENAGS